MPVALSVSSTGSRTDTAPLAVLRSCAVLASPTRKPAHALAVKGQSAQAQPRSRGLLSARSHDHVPHVPECFKGFRFAVQLNWAGIHVGYGKGPTRTPDIPCSNGLRPVKYTHGGASTGMEYRPRAGWKRGGVVVIRVPAGLALPRFATSHATRLNCSLRTLQCFIREVEYGRVAAGLPQRCAGCKAPSNACAPMRRLADN